MTGEATQSEQTFAPGYLEDLDCTRARRPRRARA